MHISRRHTLNLNLVRPLIKITTKSHCYLEDKASWTHEENESDSNQQPSISCLNVKYLSVSLKVTEPHQNIKIHRHGFRILCCHH